MSKLLQSLLVSAALVAGPFAVPVVAHAAPAAAPAKAAKSGYVEAGGVRYYYEVHGQGAPILLLHGGLGSGDMFAPVMPALSANRQVITVDLQGHGRTVLGDRPFTLQAQGADMAAIVSKLGYDKIDVIGYSLGGGVAFQFAVQHPERIKRLILVSTGYSDSGFYADMRAQQNGLNGQAAESMKETPMYQSYMAVAPRPQDFPKLLDTLGDFMRGSYDMSDQAAKLTMPTMLVYGDSDMYRPEHEVKFYQLLGGGLKDGGWQRESMSKNRLAILPGRTHYDIFFAPELISTALTFLDGGPKPVDWAAGK